MTRTVLSIVKDGIEITINEKVRFSVGMSIGAIIHLCEHLQFSMVLVYSHVISCLSRKLME